MQPHDEDLNQLALNYLYGLLDGSDAAQARSRLDSPDGQAALRDAEQFRAMLSAAAKMQFPEAKFTPPAIAVAAHSRKSNFRWVSGVVAATFLAAMAIPASATYWQGRTLAQQALLAQADAQELREEYAKNIAQWKDRVQSAGSAHLTAMNHYKDMANRYVEDVERAAADIRAKQLNVVVSGPAAITPGAPNYYQVETKNTGGQFTSATLIARVVDQNKRVVFESPPVETRGTYTLKLPVDLPLTPDRDLSLEIDAAGVEGSKAELRQKLALAAPVYLAHLTTDKPLYQSGETVHFRALVLDRFKLEPPKDDLTMTLAVLDPAGAELQKFTGLSPRSNVLRGIATGEYALPETAAGGEYTVRLHEDSGRTPDQTRKFLVNKYQPARLEKKLEFTRKSYGPGDEVVAACKAARVSGPLANQPVTAAAQVDGVAVPVENASTTDGQGAVLVKFRLPAQIERGAASINVTFNDGGAVESLVKPVPVILKKLAVEFYPEGGDLVAGVPNRIYLQARTPLGKPAEMQGHIVDGKGAKVAEVATLSDDAEPGINQGEARFQLTPAVGEKYRLVVDKPEGITSQHNLPEAKPAGIVLNTDTGVTTDREPLSLSLTNVGPSRTVVVGAYARGRLLDHARQTLAPHQTQKITLQPAPGFGGITRLTVFEEKGEGLDRQLVPQAERLVFRQPSKRVELAVDADKKAYAPGDKVNLKVNAKDEAGKAVPAVAMLGVVNQSVVVMADEKTFRSMPTHFLLTGEVEKAEDLEHVDVLLGSHPKAAAALDLLLGVQGWRRFVEQGPVMPPAKDKSAEKIAVMSGPKVRVDSIFTATKAVTDSKRPEFLRADAEITKADFDLQAAMAVPASIVDQHEQVRDAAVAAVRAVIKNYDFVATSREWLRTGLAIIGGLGLIAFCAVLIARSGWLPRVTTLAVTCAAAASAIWLGISHPEADYQPTQMTNSTVISPAEVLTTPDVDRSGAVFWGETIQNNWTLFQPTNERLSEIIAGRELADAHFRNELSARLGRYQDLQKTRNEIFSTVSGKDGENKADPANAGRGLFVDEFLAMHKPAPPVPGTAIRGFTDVDGAVTKELAVYAAQPAPAAMPRGGAGGKPAGRAGEEKEALAQRPAGAAVYKGTTGNPKFEAGQDRGEGRLEGRAPAAPAGPDVRKRDVKEVAKLADLKPTDTKKLPEQQMHRIIEQRREMARKAKDDDDAVEERLELPKPMMPASTPDLDILRTRVAARGGRYGAGYGLAIESFAVREYAHIHKPSPDGIRDDFAETVFWHPALIVPGDGASVQFDLSDSVNRYQILAAAHTLDGRLGAMKSELTARKPLNVEPKLPVEITAGDQIDMPVAVANETDRSRNVKLDLETPGLAIVGTQPDLNWTQPANTSARKVFSLRPILAEGIARLRLAATGEDAMEAKLPIVPQGFPIRGQISNELRNTATHTVTLPQTWVEGSLRFEVSFFPTPLADLVRGLDGLLQEPGGCFEQTSTTNYPNVLVMDYLRETKQANPEVLARAKGMLDRGYNRLVSFEVPSGSKKEGYEWFGHAPAHEALTAYGLLQFRDMARVADVDPAMIARTQQYLMARRDGKGGFQRSKGALDSFGRASEAVTNAYIVWSMTESGKDDDVTKELDKLQQDAAANNDPYYLALVANALINRDRADAGVGLLNRLVKLQAADGSLNGTEKSITGSQGSALKVETTALTVLGWLKANRPSDFSEPTRKAVKWIAQQRQGQGAFGPTQSTIMALKALVAFARANKQTPESGRMTLQTGDKILATVDYNADQQDAIVIGVPDAEKLLKPGDNSITLTTSGKNFYPYTVAWRYQSLQPPSAQGCAVKLTTQLERSELAEGESTRLKVALENVSKAGQGMTIAIVGLPAGIKLPDDFKQLRDLARVVDGKPGTISFWELRGRDLILYWRDLAPDAKVEIHLDVIAHIPGKYQGPASRAYLYYDPEVKHWTTPLSATIAAK